MPRSTALIFLALIIHRFLVNLLLLHGADGTDLGVVSPKFSFRIQDGMNVQLGRLWFSSQLA